MRQQATFAAGCFWGVEHTFRQLHGVKEVISGYTGGHTVDPSYEEVCTGNTGHAEAVQISFDENQISYNDLLDVFWNCHNPTELNRQGPDKGTQYRSAIFYHSDEQHRLAENSKKIMADSGRFSKPIVTEIVAAGVFYNAEEYHQRYVEKNGGGHCKM